jgi:UPF0042 nucleotide-binding protein
VLSTVTEYLLITGMSGAGRSTAAAALEDAGWYVIDNMPSSLIDAVFEALRPQRTAALAEEPPTATKTVALQASSECSASSTSFPSPLARPAESRRDRVALVIGRSGTNSAEEALAAMERLEAKGGRVRLLYLDAPDHVLVRRFEGTRRRHPIGDMKVEEAIAGERTRSAVLRDRADVVLDTGELNVNQLRARIMDLFGDPGEQGAIRVSISSFGYKHGIPLDADIVLDCRFLPNPYWVGELQGLSGLDEPVREFVMSSEGAEPFLHQVVQLVDLALPGYRAEGRTYLNVAFGCTGGRHRSVVMAEELAKRLSAASLALSQAPTVFHRDIER